MSASEETSVADCCQQFIESYEISALPIMRSIERSVLGSDYGGTSWTTRRQADQIVEALGLEPGVRLIDIGAGSGWPALHLAAVSGCDVTLIDLPFNALTQAGDRAREDGLDTHVALVSGSAVTLPFGDGVFDVVTHSDVLCCLPEKMEALLECRRVAVGHARMSFSVIAVSPGLSDTDRQRAVEAGPPFVDAACDYAELLNRAGWRVLQRTDVTAAYRDSLHKLTKAFGECAELPEILGADVLDEFRQRRLEQISAVDTGLLCREVFLAEAR